MGSYEPLVVESTQGRLSRTGPTGRPGRAHRPAGPGRAVRHQAKNVESSSTLGL